jgi:hypothetical protein
MPAFTQGRATPYPGCDPPYFFITLEPVMPGTAAARSDAHSNPKVPVGVDPTRASIARVYDAFLNGKDNYEIDREVLAGVQKAAPEAQDLATENRGFLIRACRFLATQTGITQYLDCGSGLPTAENTHQVVQRINPDSMVVYVDNDPVVLAHGRCSRRTRTPTSSRPTSSNRTSSWRTKVCGSTST